MNLRPPKYKAGVLTTKPQHSVKEEEGRWKGVGDATRFPASQSYASSFTQLGLPEYTACTNYFKI